MRAGKRQGGWEQIMESDEAGGLRAQVRKSGSCRQLCQAPVRPPRTWSLLLPVIRGRHRRTPARTLLHQAGGPRSLVTVLWAKRQGDAFHARPVVLRSH